MAISVIRPRPRTQRGSMLSGTSSLHSARPPARDWAAVRGALFWRGTCDLAGGFPGFAQQGGFLARARVLITAHYLLVEEGRSRGFGLALADITSAFVVDLHDRGDSLVRLNYLDGELTRTFTVRFCGPLAALHPSHRARQMLRALHATQATPVLTSQALPEPELVVSWNAVHQVQDEPLHWQDRALAPIVLGERLRPSDIWLTEASLVWGCGSGRGVNRLPLPLITDVIPAHVEDRWGTPAIYVGFTDDADRRHEVPFLFNWAATTGENEQHEVAMLNAMRAHGIPLGAATGRCQPWRIDFEAFSSAAVAVPISPTFERAAPPVPPALPIAVPPAPPVDPAPQPADEAAQDTPAPGDAAEAAVVAHDTVPATDAGTDEASIASESGPPQSLGTASGTMIGTDAANDAPPPTVDAIMEPVTQEESDAATDLQAAAGPAEQEVKLDTAAADCPRCRRLEATAMANLATILRRIDERLAGKPESGPALAGPTPADQSLAYHELADAAIAGSLTWDEVRQRRARLTAMIEATASLRTLLELHASGHLDAATLQCKRLEVKDELSFLVMSS